MSSFPWHRVFHPLCGADPLTLAELALRRGPPSLAGLPAFAVAVATSLVRLPFTALDMALGAAAPRGEVAPPVFIVGHPRSGTTHLHNLMAASGAFSTVPPVLAAMPWESGTLGPLLRPFIDPYLPETRLIDGVALRPDAPTEDEVGLANLGWGSYFHAIYFPRRFAQDYRDGLLGGTPRRERARERAVRRYVLTMARRVERPLLLKNPAYTAQTATLARLFPGARVIHIHRDPRAVFASARRALRRVLDELALQDWSHVDVDDVILETYPAMMRALRDQAARLPASRFAEVAFEDLVAEPRNVLARLWHRLELPGDERAMVGIEAYLETVRDYRAAPARLSAGQLEDLQRGWVTELDLYGRDQGQFEGT